MALVIDSTTGIVYLYPDGIPIFEASVLMSDIVKFVARKTSLSAMTDPFFARMTSEQKKMIELHGEGSRIFGDFLELGAGDILPVFQPLQRLMPHFKDENDDTIESYEYDTVTNPGKIIYRWQNMDTRIEGMEHNFTNMTKVDIVVDTNIVRNVNRYLKEALRDYVLLEFYKTIGHPINKIEYAKQYALNRQYVAYWAKNTKGVISNKNNA